MPGRSDPRRAGKASAGKPGGRTTIFELMTFISAIALGVAAMLALWEESDAGLVVQGTSVLLLPICWALTVLRMLGPACVAGGGSPPGVAACLAVSVGSLLNLFTSWDTILLYVGPRSLLLVAMLRAVTPLPLAVAVAAAGCSSSLTTVGSRSRAGSTGPAAASVFTGCWPGWHCRSCATSSPDECIRLADLRT